MKQGRQAAQTAIAESGVRFLFEEARQIPALAVERTLHDRSGAQVDDVVVQHAPEQKLHRQVVHALGVGLLAGQAGFHPAVRHQIADEPCNRLEPLTRTSAHGIHDVFAEQVSVRPVGVVARQPQSFEPALEGRLCRTLGSLRHDRRSCVTPRLRPGRSSHEETVSLGPG
jgi:hypothetical protein